MTKLSYGPKGSTEFKPRGLTVLFIPYPKRVYFDRHICDHGCSVRWCDVVGDWKRGSGLVNDDVMYEYRDMIG